MSEIWTEEKISNLIRDEIEENLNLEYKSAEALVKSEIKKKEISKDVSALANSDGGIIIYGIAEYNEPKKSHLPEKIDPINRKEFPKEWVEQILNTNIFPRIPNLLITPVKIQKSNELVIYVIEVPKSNTAHQAFDKRYYKRYNFESIPMYDYEIKDILNRAQLPILRLEFEIIQESYEYKRSNLFPFPLYTQEDPKPEIITHTKLAAFGYNEGKILANYVISKIDIPLSILIEQQDMIHQVSEINGFKYVRRYGDNTSREVIGFSGSGDFKIPNYGPSHYNPILPKTRSRLATVELKNDFFVSDQKIFWTIHADNAEPITGATLVSDIEYKKLNRLKKS